MKMSAHVRFYYGSIYTGSENGMDFIILSTPLNNVERQQGITALLLYQVQTVSPVRWLSNGRDLQRPSIPNTFFKHPVEIWGVLLYDKRKEYSGGKNV